MFGEEHDIATTLPEWRQRQDDNTDSVIEIRPESSNADLLGEIRIRRRDDRDVNCLRLGAAQSAHRTILDRLQDLGLGSLRQQADLVEEEGAPAGGLKESRLRLPRIGECALLVTE